MTDATTGVVLVFEVGRLATQFCVSPALFAVDVIVRVVLAQLIAGVGVGVGAVTSAEPQDDNSVHAFH